MGACCSNSAFAKTPENDAIEKDLRELGEILSNEIRVLLLGTGESGKSTVFKQMKILQDKGGFLPEEIMVFSSVPVTVFGGLMTDDPCFDRPTATSFVETVFLK